MTQTTIDRAELEKVRGMVDEMEGYADDGTDLRAKALAILDKMLGEGMTIQPTDKNPPAFPLAMQLNEFGGVHSYPEYGMTLRDYFAIRCSEDEISQRIPRTVGEVADALVKRGRITKDSRERDVIRSYKESDVIWLRSVVRYEFADDMLKEREI
jgi:hypothetical protein